MDGDETHIRGSTECISFWRREGTDGAEILKGRYRELRFAPHAHDRYLFGLITGGALEIVEPDRSAVASTGQVILYNHDQVHWGHSASPNGWSILSVYWPPEHLTRAVRELGTSAGGTIGFRDIVVEDRTLARRMASLSAAGDLAHVTLASECLLSGILIDALTRHAGRYVRRPPVGRESRAARIAREFIEDNYPDDISLQALSDLSGIGKYWLIKAFKAAYGVPPHAYLTNVRVRQAMRRLRDGMGIAEAAADCGFADQSHLSRMFKRSTGLTPGRFKG